MSKVKDNANMRRRGERFVIAPSMMELIKRMDECDRSLLLGEDPEAIPQEKHFRAWLHKNMPIKEYDTRAFLETAAECDLTFKDAWLLFQDEVDREWSAKVKRGRTERR